MAVFTTLLDTKRGPNEMPRVLSVYKSNTFISEWKGLGGRGHCTTPTAVVQRITQNLALRGCLPRSQAQSRPSPSEWVGRWTCVSSSSGARERQQPRQRRRTQLSSGSHGQHGSPTPSAAATAAPDP